MSASNESNQSDEFPDRYDPSLKSLRSNHDERTVIILLNLTNRAINVIWINFTSHLIRYCTLEPNCPPIQMNTYQTHPWIFADVRTGQLMHVRRKEVLWPTKPDPKKTALPVIIHFPLTSLKTASMWTILNRMQSIDVLDELELPRQVIHDLKMLSQRHQPIVNSIDDFQNIYG